MSLTINMLHVVSGNFRVGPLRFD